MCQESIIIKWMYFVLFTTFCSLNANKNQLIAFVFLEILFLCQWAFSAGKNDWIVVWFGRRESNYSFGQKVSPWSSEGFCRWQHQPVERKLGCHLWELLWTTGILDRLPVEKLSTVGSSARNPWNLSFRYISWTKSFSDNSRNFQEVRFAKFD